MFSRITYHELRLRAPPTEAQSCLVVSSMVASVSFPTKQFPTLHLLPTWISISSCCFLPGFHLLIFKRSMHSFWLTHIAVLSSRALRLVIAIRLIPCKIFPFPFSLSSGSLFSPLFFWFFFFFPPFLSLIIPEDYSTWLHG